MMVRKESMPKVNIYSSKILFEQVDNRNKKRMAQMLRRKTALSAKTKEPRADNKDSPPKNSSNLPKTEKNDDDLLFINIIREKEINIENILNDCNNNQSIDIKTESEIDKEKNKDNDKDKDIASANYNNNINNVINLDCSSAVSNIVNENNNYYNNSSTNNSNNNSLMYKDSQEKEINISNLDNDSFDEIIINKSNNQEEEENDRKIMTNNIFDYDKDDDNLITKEEHKLREENEFALKYLTSSSDSFVQLDNNLVARAKAQGGDITDSYFQALFPQLSLDTNKSLKTKNYEVIDAIKEEKEIETPLRIKNDNSRKSKMINKGNRSKGSIGLNIHIKTSNNNSSVHKILKKSPSKKYNYRLYKKKSISKINKKDDNKSNILKEGLHKSSTNLRSKKILKKNNTMTKITKSNKKNKDNIHLNCQNSVSSLSNLNGSYVNKFTSNINNRSSILFSSFSSNLYTKPKNEYKLNKNIQKKINLKNSYNNILYKKNENELNDILISKYIENANVNRTRNNTKISKINRHYLKNINNYQKYKTANTIDKKNKNENILNTESTKALNSIYASKINCFNSGNNGIYSGYYNSLDITKRNTLSQRYNSRKYLLNKINNDSNINININKDLCKKFKNLNVNHSFEKRKIKINHKPSCSIMNNSGKMNQKIKNNLSKYERVKSYSKLSYKKKNINYPHKSYMYLKRSKTYKKNAKLNPNESIIINSSYNKSNKTTKNNYNMNNTFTNTCSHFNLKKGKFTPFHKKIDYSYVKPKVETGLSEIMIKKLLNNNKKLSMKSAKKIETEKKQLLIKKCKITMNKTIENFRQMASRIKRKLFRGGNQDKNKNDDVNNHTIHSNRNSNKNSCKNE